MDAQIKRGLLDVLILAAIKYVYDHKAVTETFTNENHNGNGLYEVVREWAVQKKLL